MNPDSAYEIIFQSTVLPRRLPRPRVLLTSAAAGERDEVGQDAGLGQEGCLLN